MTVLLNYEAIKIPWVPWNTEYGLFITFESIGASALEIWLETETVVPGVFDRVLLAPQYYTAIFSGRPPTYSGGAAIIAARVVPDTVSQLSIERNTPITQLVDFNNFDSFFMDNIEFSLDKQTMIIQELAYKKCSVNVTVPIDQLLTFDPQDVLYSTMIAFALDKLIAYMVEMVANGDSCFDEPESA